MTDTPSEFPADSTVTDLFDSGGGLSAALSQFELRAGQITLVAAIERAINRQQHLIAEAGTGIGKTFAYLLPTLAKGKRVLVSTATKHLQDQVYFKDLPIIEKVLGRSVSACLLKGRANYFCHYRYNAFIVSNFGLTRSQLQKVDKLNDWLAVTSSGDLAEVAEFSYDDYSFRKQITSTTDNCVGGECPYFNDCYVQKIREKARQSELVIVNHALLMADIVLKETGFAEILPDAEVVVIDEAHHLPKIATQAFAEQISYFQLTELARDARQVYRNHADEYPDFEDCTETLLACTADFRDALSHNKSAGSTRLSELKQLSAYRQFKTLMQAYKPFLEALQQLSTHDEDFRTLHERAQVTAASIRHVFTTDNEQNMTNNTAHNTTPELADSTAGNTAVNAHSVAILEWNSDGFRASRLPIHLGNRFREVLSCYADSWLFVSATLSVNDSFDFFKTALGLDKAIPTLTVNSPFDYPNHAVIHIAEHLPDPNQPDFISELVKLAQPVLQKTRGRAFMLFTSHRNLNEAAELMADSGFNLFIQGEMPKAQLIDAFMQSKNAVLLGTVSFWEGVDVAGEKLSCVIIDKIPFPSPGDPMIAEQEKYLRRQGKNAFAECYIPRAATLLKQGAGRLIRSADDTGILVLGDNRMHRKSYGRQLLAAMPPARLVDNDELLHFIEKHL